MQGDKIQKAAPNALGQEQRQQQQQQQKGGGGDESNGSSVGGGHGRRDACSFTGWTPHTVLGREASRPGRALVCNSSERTLARAS